MRNNTFQHNYADSGAAVVLDYSTAITDLVGYFGQDQSTPEISSNNFTNNTANSSASVILFKGLLISNANIEYI